MLYATTEKRNNRRVCYSPPSLPKTTNVPKTTSFPKRIGTESPSVCTARTSVPGGGVTQDRSAVCRMRGRSVMTTESETAVSGLACQVSTADYTGVTLAP